MTLDPLTGHVVVLAGTGTTHGERLLARGVQLAVVTNDRGAIDDLEQAAARHPTAMLLSYCADPADPAVWQRVAPHIEQRIGPVDVVLCSEEVAAVVDEVFASDMNRRGHGVIVPIRGQADPVADLPQLLRHRP